MPVVHSPLRYPGGKSQLKPFIVALMRQNRILHNDYAEPYAGGCSLALALLFENHVQHLWLNDLDPNIYAFWDSALHKTDALCGLIEDANVTIEEWHRQRETFRTSRSALNRGFATFFLNRTNRSGIIRGGVIGGYNQTGNYKLDCRFPKADLIKKIQRIGRYRDAVTFTNLDGRKFVEQLDKKIGARSLINLDPPYFRQGPELYSNYFTAKDHADLAVTVRDLQSPWIVTYDDTPEVRSFYQDLPLYLNPLRYYAQEKRVGTELMVIDPRLDFPESPDARKALSGIPSAIVHG